jgi:hypothetical protein
MSEKAALVKFGKHEHLLQLQREADLLIEQDALEFELGQDDLLGRN